MDTAGHFCGNTCYFLPIADTFILGVLNSSVIEWWYGKTTSRIRGGYLRAFSDNVKRIPIAQPSAVSKILVSRRAQQILSLRKDDAGAFVANLEAEIDGLVAHLYGLSESEFRTILDELELPDPTRVAAADAYRDAAKGQLK